MNRIEYLLDSLEYHLLLITYYSYKYYNSFIIIIELYLNLYYPLIITIISSYLQPDSIKYELKGLEIKKTLILFLLKYNDRIDSLINTCLCKYSLNLFIVYSLIFINDLI